MLLKTKEPMMMLAGDIGGTKSRLGLFSVSKGDYHLLSEKTFPSQDYKGLEIIVKEFLGGKKRLSLPVLEWPVLWSKKR